MTSNPQSLPRSNFRACRHCLKTYPKIYFSQPLSLVKPRFRVGSQFEFSSCAKTTRWEAALFEKLAPESFFTEIMWAFTEIMCVYQNHVGRSSRSVLPGRTLEFRSASGTYLPIPAIAKCNTCCKTMQKHANDCHLHRFACKTAMQSAMNKLGSYIEPNP